MAHPFISFQPEKDKEINQRQVGMPFLTTLHQFEGQEV